MKRAWLSAHVTDKFLFIFTFVILTSEQGVVNGKMVITLGTKGSIEEVKKLRN